MMKNAGTLKGGLADKEKTKKSDVDAKQLAKGIKVEREHVNNKKLQEEIAMDHLTEDPKYYDHLKEMEKKAFFKGFLRRS